MPYRLEYHYYKSTTPSWGEYFYSYLPWRRGIAYLVYTETIYFNEAFNEFKFHLNKDSLSVSLTPDQVTKILITPLDKGYKHVIDIQNGTLNYDPNYNCLVSVSDNLQESHYLLYDDDLRQALKVYFKLLTGGEY